jgi:hypothetical protein
LGGDAVIESPSHLGEQVRQRAVAGLARARHLLATSSD